MTDKMVREGNRKIKLGTFSRLRPPDSSPAPRSEPSAAQPSAAVATPPIQPADRPPDVLQHHGFKLGAAQEVSSHAETSALPSTEGSKPVEPPVSCEDLAPKETLEGACDAETSAAEAESAGEVTFDWSRFSPPEQQAIWRRMEMQEKLRRRLQGRM